MARKQYDRRVVQQALRQMCYGPDGKLTKNARYVAAVLNRYCDGNGDNPFPRATETGALDPTAIVRRAARREVFDFMAKMLAVTIEDRLNLEE